ncbi:MAG: hypothetical protein J7L22_06765 [Candidatus Marinimicrobia bacterium]|nr:hypothetical protein [Candidatus Neomarinimicrobiota bacterium]
MSRICVAVGLMLLQIMAGEMNIPHQLWFEHNNQIIGLESVARKVICNLIEFRAESLQIDTLLTSVQVKKTAVSMAIKALKNEGKVTSPKACYYSATK